MRSLTLRPYSDMPLKIEIKFLEEKFHHKDRLLSQRRMPRFINVWISDTRLECMVPKKLSSRMAVLEKEIEERRRASLTSHLSVPPSAIWKVQQNWAIAFLALCQRC